MEQTRVSLPAGGRELVEVVFDARERVQRRCGTDVVSVAGEAPRFGEGDGARVPRVERPCKALSASMRNMRRKEKWLMTTLQLMEMRPQN
jgi:hypothetical protein